MENDTLDPINSLYSSSFKNITTKCAAKIFWEVSCRNSYCTICNFCFSNELAEFCALLTVASLIDGRPCLVDFLRMRIQAAKTTFTSATDSSSASTSHCTIANSLSGYLLLLIPYIQLRNIHNLLYILGIVKDTRSHAQSPHVPGII